MPLVPDEIDSHTMYDQKQQMLFAKLLCHGKDVPVAGFFPKEYACQDNYVLVSYFYFIAKVNCFDLGYTLQPAP